MKMIFFKCAKCKRLLIGNPQGYVCTKECEAQNR